jgi:peptidyl-prolyl cis-trans isomerase SurA
MTRHKYLLPWLLALLWMTCGAEVVDRIIAVVNGHLVTWSDLDEQMRFEALENGRSLGQLGEADRRAAFQHLVQDRILRDQMQGTAPATASEVEARIDELRATWHEEKDETRWAATLNRYGLSAAELRALAANQVEVLRFMEFRVRPLVRVSDEEVEEYYTNTLVQQVVSQGKTPEPLEQVADKIRQLLVEQKTNREMEKWLDNLKAQSRVQILWDGVRSP